MAATIKLTDDLIRAAAHDAGSRAMRKAGRSRWNEADWNEACRVYAILNKDEGEEGEDKQ